MKTPPQPGIWDHVLEGNYCTLFIDRDGGVIRRLPGDEPVTDIDEVEVKPDFLANAAALSSKYRNIIVLSTLVEHGRRLPDRKTQNRINAHISDAVKAAGGRIDGFYTEWVTKADCKAVSPGPLLPLLARRDFPTINFSTSLMVGVTTTDRLLAYNCGMKFVQYSEEPIDDDGNVSFDDIDEERELIRDGVARYIESLNRLVNSPLRIKGIRLAARCVCHALSCGRNVFISCCVDSGLDVDHLQESFNTANKGHDLPYRLQVVKATEGRSLTETINGECHYGDVIFGIAVNSNDKQMLEGMYAAQERGVITVSITGARPGGMDMSDVVLKVPSTAPEQIQGSFRLILTLIHKLVAHEYSKGNFSKK